jgi:hypothetical protein
MASVRDRDGLHSVKLRRNPRPRWVTEAAIVVALSAVIVGGALVWVLASTH